MKPYFILAVFAWHAHAAEAEPRRVESYIQALKQAGTSGAFSRTFGEMVREFHAGQLLFEDSDVITIVNITRSKPYADHVLAEVYGWAGTMFGNGRMGEALAYFMESADLYEKQHKHLAQALSCFEIALVQHKAENYDEAQEYYFKTMQLGGDSLHYRTKINCYNGLALILRERQHYDSAQRDFRSALAVARHQHDTAWTGILLGNIASIHLRQAHYDSSLYYYKENLRFIKHTQEVENEIETYAHLGRAYISIKEYRLAMVYLDSAVHIIASRKIAFNDFFNPMDYINESYAYIYQARGDYEKAYAYFTEYHRIAQEKQRQVNGRSLRQLQTSLTRKQKQNEVELLQRINEANLATINEQRYTQIAFASVILLVSALAFIAYSTSRQRKKLNLELFQTNAELARLNTVKDKLFSVISHDLRGPLSNLKTILGMFHQGQIDEQEFSGVSAKLSHELEASGNALENLLQWARTQLSENKINAEKISLSAIAGRVILLFRKDLETKGITCQNLVPAMLVAWADKNQVEIILRNLIGNAIKFTPRGGVVTVHGKYQGSRVSITVQDNGIGISAEAMDQLFKPGRHFSSLGTNQEKGTGIGLIIVREMVLSHGGDIKVSSPKGQGTEFVFTLPVPVS